MAKADDIIKTIAAFSNTRLPDIILNLKRIVIRECNSHSSSTCGGPVYFEFECDTKAGYMEDPDMTGEIKVLSVKKEKDNYSLKVQFKKDKLDLDDCK